MSPDAGADGVLNAREPGQRASIRALLALAISASALTVLSLAVGVGPLPIDAADGAWAELRDGGAGGSILAAVDTAGSLPVWAVAIVLIALLLARSGHRRAMELGLLSLLAEVATTILKLVVARPRPSGGPTLDLLVASGFPSGHVTRTAVLVGAMLVLVPWGARHPKLTIAAGVAAVAVMGLARVSGRAHYTSDVLGACLLAAAILATWQLVRSGWGR